MMALYPLGAPDTGFTIFSQVGSSPVSIPGFWPWQLVTYSFLHGSISHILFNMFALWMFGVEIENYWGSQRFATFYFVCVVGAGLTQLVASYGAMYPTVGASGGVFGILLAFGLMFPNRRIMLLIPPIPMKAKYFVIGYGLIELYFGFTATQSGVAHFAHLGGMAFGFGLIQYWRGNLPVEPDRTMRW
jgi:membrane associated rhomboid family serine protease